MNRIPRRARFACALAFVCAAGAALAASPAFNALSSKDAAGGLRDALGKGIDVAVSQLGAPNGFLNDPKVTIPLPSALDKAQRGMKMLGMGAQGDALKATMNHAAESAVSEAKPIFKQALEHMSVEDAKGILTGGEGSATAYFRHATDAQLRAKFKPVVSEATAKLGLAAKYDQYAGKASHLGLVPAEDANLDDYVTARALDGLFSRISDEEREIRKNPMGQASALIKKVFGSL